MDSNEVPRVRQFLNRFRKPNTILLPEEPKSVANSIAPEPVPAAVEIEPDTTVARRLLEIEHNVRHGLGNTAPELPTDMEITTWFGTPHALTGQDITRGKTQMNRFINEHGIQYFSTCDLTDNQGAPAGKWIQRVYSPNLYGALTEYSEELKNGARSHKVIVGYRNGAIAYIEETDNGDPQGEGKFKATLSINGTRRNVIQEQGSERIYPDLPPPEEIEDILHPPTSTPTSDLNI